VDADKVRDKDGISAAVDLLGLLSELSAKGQTFDDHLAEFAEKFGAFASSQISIRVADLAEIPRTMAALRLSPPASIGGVPVLQIDDFASGFGTFPPSDLLRFQLEGGGRVIVRPSGTEPKLKCYLDTWSTDGTAAERSAAADALLAKLDAGMRELLS
jgi:phosphomannomutase